MIKFIGAFAGTILVLLFLTVVVHTLSPSSTDGPSHPGTGRYQQSQ